MIKCYYQWIMDHFYSLHSRDGYNDNQNICDVVLSIYSLSSMKDKAPEDTVAYISGSLLIINEGPDAIDGPHMVIDASLWKTLGSVLMIWNLQMLAWPQQISLVKSLQLQMDLLENLVYVGSYNMKVCGSLFSVIIQL